MTRADVEEEIRRARDLGPPTSPTTKLGDSLIADDHYPKLDDADLRGVDLSGLDLGLANLYRADLREAILEGTNLAGAGLIDADLRNTKRTRGAVLIGAVMYSARLGGADLSRDVLRREDTDDPPDTETAASRVFLKNATYNDDTRWPKDFDPKEHGARKADPADDFKNNVAPFARSSREEGRSGPRKPLSLAGCPGCVSATLS